MKVLFILKGVISKKEKIIKDIKAVFGDKLYNIKETEHPTHAIDLAKKNAKYFTHIIAVGGDGTLNEVVNGILLSEYRPTVGFFPAGTANDYSASIHCPATLKELKDSIIYNRTAEIYLGKGEFTDIHNFPTSRYFINIADIGIGGEVVQRVNNDQSKLSAELKFFKNIIITFFDFKSQNIKTIINDKHIDEKVLSLVVAKGKYFGGRIGIAPHADPRKNDLDIVKIGDISVLEYLKKLPKLKKGAPIQHKDLEYYKTSELEIKTENHLPIDMDGEFVGYTPVKFSTLDTPINFIIA